MRKTLTWVAALSAGMLLWGAAGAAWAAPAAKPVKAAKPATPAAKPATPATPAAADPAPAAAVAKPATPAAPAATPSALPGVEWDELTQAIRNIEVAAKVDDAAAAYAQGCTVNRQSIKLQDAYMRKLLKLGRPDLAYVPAQALTTIDPKNGIAFGDIMYVMVKRGLVSYPLALANGLKAIDLDGENPGICIDVAQLVAWYEADNKRPPLDPDVMAILKKLTSGPAYSKEYAKASKDAKAGFGKLEQERQAKKKEADEATAEAKKLETKHKQLNETLKAKGTAYDAAIRLIETTKDRLDRTQEDAARSTDYRQRENLDRTTRTAQQQLRTARGNADKLLTEGKEMRKEADDTKKEWETKRDHAARLQRAVASTDDLPTSFGWVPPAVDGVITPDLMASAPKARPAVAAGTAGTAAGGTAAATPAKTSYLAPDRPAATAAPAEPSLAARVAEAEAADKLSLAKMGVDSKDANMKAMAKNLLAEILKSYPNTKAAAEAKQLAAKAN